MKNSVKFVLAAFAVGFLLSFYQNISAQKRLLPTLRGSEALEKLKEFGGYESLTAAFNAARRENGRQIITETKGTDGQYDQLSVTDGAADDMFGFSVAVSGDTAVVGSPFDDINANADQGSAYIFTRSGTTWTQQAKLTASDGAADDIFGFSVAISGNTTIVGAYADDSGANLDQGSAYIFTRNGTTWTQQAKLTAADGTANDLFGSSVSVNVNTAIVGAVQDNVGANNLQGSAYIFVRSGTTWTQEAQLTAVEGASNDLFGESVAVAGDTVIVGADGDDVGINQDQGSAYIFQRSGTTWTQQAQLNATGGAANDFFGFSVAVSSNTVIVGADGDDVGTNQNQGSAYVFIRNGTNWTQQAQLNATGGAANDSFGASVSISSDLAVVGAPLNDVGGNSDQGSAYAFQRSGTVWTPIMQLNNNTGAAGDQFGSSAAISSNQVVGGAPFSDASAIAANKDDNRQAAAPTAVDQGAVFFFSLPLQPTAAVISISGRVITPRSSGLTNALVTLTDSNGNSRTVLTGKFGTFVFREVAVGETYLLTVASKRYNYSPQTVSPTENIADIVFTAQ